MRKEIQIGSPLNEVACRELSHPYDETVASALKKVESNFEELYEFIGVPFFAYPTEQQGKTLDKALSFALPTKLGE